MPNMWTYTTTTSATAYGSSSRLYTQGNDAPVHREELYVTRIPDYAVDQKRRRKLRYRLSPIIRITDMKDNNSLFLYGGQNNLIIPPLIAGRHGVSLTAPDTLDTEAWLYARILQGYAYKQLIDGISPDATKVPQVNDIMFAPRYYACVSNIKKVLSFNLVDRDKYSHRIIEPKLIADMIFDVFDYTMSDLTFISNFIRYQIKNEPNIISTMKDRVKNLVSDFILGAICITPIIVPGPEKFDPEYDYYPPSWQLFEGEEQYAYHFQPSKKAYANGWREGIFTPAGNLVPVSVFEMADKPVIYVTRRLKSMRKPELDRLIEWKL